MSKRVSAIVLAAGGSTRLGRPKQLLTIDGETLLRRAVRAVAESAVTTVVVVLGAAAEQAAREVADLRVEVVRNEKWRDGIASSIQAGLAAVGPTASDAVLITLCDQPFLDRELVERLLETYRTSDGHIVACAYDGTLGVPAIFGATHFAALAALRGDEGARRLLLRLADEVVAVPFPRGAIDIDTEDAYRALLAVGKAEKQS